MAAHQWIMEPVKKKTTNTVNADKEESRAEENAQTIGEEEINEPADPVDEGGETEPVAAVSKYQEELDDPVYMEENNIYTVEPDRKSVV